MLTAIFLKMEKVKRGIISYKNYQFKALEIYGCFLHVNICLPTWQTHD